MMAWSALQTTVSDATDFNSSYRPHWAYSSGLLYSGPRCVCPKARADRSKRAPLSRLPGRLCAHAYRWRQMQGKCPRSSWSVETTAANIQLAFDTDDD